LPAQNFKWIYDENELHNILANLPDEYAQCGYVLEVDLSVPAELHDRLSDLPPAPIQQSPPGSKVKKLLLTFEPKKHYIIHSALLKFYIEVMGVVVDAVHRAIEFEQEYVFRSYIEKNTQMRANSSSKFKKDYYKLKNNSLYGKTVENLRRRKDLRLCNNEPALVAQASKPCFRRSIIIKENLVAAVLCKEEICLDRPVYIGQAVLDLSKLRMYRLQYQDLQQYREMFHGSSISIVAGDTDSFFLEVKGVDLKTQLLPRMMQDGLLDTSNYPSDSPLYSREYENKIGLFKDESAGKEEYSEWIFLRPKCYSLLSEDGQATKKAKGVMRSTPLMHQQYRDIYKSFRPSEADAPPPKLMRVEQRSIRSENHQLVTLQYSKVALSINDDKRQWISQNRSLPYGHYSL
jgi:hypothetical protein